MNKWKEMTSDQQDQLVAEKVMRWVPGICDGEWGKQPISSDGWICLKCGYEGYWGAGFEHENIPPRYTASMNAAWPVVRRMNIPEHGKHDLYTRFIEALEQIVGSDMFYDLFFCNPDDPSDEHLTPERICLAALKAVGYVEEA